MRPSWGFLRGLLGRPFADLGGLLCRLKLLKVRNSENASIIEQHMKQTMHLRRLEASWRSSWGDLERLMGFVGLLQATAGGLGSILGHLRGTMGPSWALLGSSCTSWRRLGTVLVSILSQLSYLGGHLGTVWGRVGALWEPPWPTCGHLVGLLGLGGCRNSKMARTPTHIENIMIINQFTPPPWPS